MHRAPVVGVVVLDGHGAPLPEPLEVAHDLARSPDMTGSHHVLVVSEEQFKVGARTRVKGNMCTDVWEWAAADMCHTWGVFTS